MPSNSKGENEPPGIITSRRIGGTKGHVSEVIDGPLLDLYRAYRWRMIPQCTGRYTCRDHSVASSVGPLELLDRTGIAIAGCGTPDIYSFNISDRPDTVVVVPMDDLNEIGIITYVKKEEHTSRFIHTLNAKSGFRRKLTAMGLRVADGDINIVCGLGADGHPSA